MKLNDRLKRITICERFSTEKLYVVIRPFMNWFKPIALVTGLAFLAGCSSTQYSDTAASPRAVEVPAFGQEVASTVETKKNLVLPQELAGIPFDDITIYEQSTPGQGVAYQYHSSDTSIDISIFDGGYSQIQEGIFSEGVHHFFEDAKSQIAAVEYQGYYNITEILTDDLIDIGDQQFLYFNFNFDDGTAARSSHLFLSAYDGNFLKIRLTMPEENNEQILANFLADFSELITNHTTS